MKAPYSFAGIFAAVAVLFLVRAGESNAIAAAQHEIRRHGCLFYAFAQQVVVARHTLPPGRAISREDLVALNMPDQYLDQRGKGAVKPGELSSAVGHSPAHAVLEGDVLRWDDF